MIKLKNILTELDFYQGDADGWWGTSYGPATSFSDYALSLRYKGIGNEMKVLLKSKRSGVDIINEPMPEKLKKLLKSRKISGTDDLMVIKLKRGTNAYNDYYLLDFSNELIKDIVVGTIHTQSAEAKTVGLKGEGVHWSQISKAYRGRGYGKILYDAVLDSAKLLFSDETLYEGSLGMWIHHMQKKSFFGGILNSEGFGDIITNYVVPLDPRMIAKKQFLEDSIQQFVVTNDRSLLSKTVRQLEHNVGGIDMTREFAIIEAMSKFKIDNEYLLDVGGFVSKKTKGTPVLVHPDDLDYAGDDGMKAKSNLQKLPPGFTFEDYLELFGGLDSFISLAEKSHGYEIDMEVIYPGSSAKRIKLAILRLEDVTLLLKDKSDGISVQILQ